MSIFNSDEATAHRDSIIEGLDLCPSGFKFPDEIKNNKLTGWACRLPFKNASKSFRINKPFSRNFSMYMGVSNTSCHGSRLGAIREAGFECYDYTHGTKEEEYEHFNKKTGMRFTRTRTVPDPHWEIFAESFWFAPEEPIFESFETWAEWYVSNWSPFLEEDEPEEAVLEILLTHKKIRGRYESMIEAGLKNHDSLICSPIFMQKSVELIPKVSEVSEVSEEVLQTSEAESWWKKYTKKNWSADYDMKSFLKERYFNTCGERDTDVFTAWLDKAQSLTEGWVAECGMKEVVEYLKQLEQNHFDKMDESFGKKELEA